MCSLHSSGCLMLEFCVRNAWCHRISVSWASLTRQTTSAQQYSKPEIIHSFEAVYATIGGHWHAEQVCNLWGMSCIYHNETSFLGCNDTSLIDLCMIHVHQHVCDFVRGASKTYYLSWLMNLPTGMLCRRAAKTPEVNHFCERNIKTKSPGL